MQSDELNLTVYERYNNSDVRVFNEFAPHLNIVEKANFPIWAIIGLPGSLISIIVWSSRTMRRGGSAAAAIYQASLGVVDFSFFLVYANWYLHIAWQLGVLDHPVICELFPVINYLIQYLSPTLAFAFTLERYLAICHPFRSQQCMIRSTGKGSFMIVGILILFCLCIAGVQALIYTYGNGMCNTRSVLEDPTTIESTLYTNWVFFTEAFFFFCLPITCLILNILVICVLRQSIKMKKQNLQASQLNGMNNTNANKNMMDSNSDKGARSSTLTLLCTSFYLICAHLSVAIAVLIYKLLPTGNLYLTDEQIRQDPIWTAYFRFFTVRVLIECFAMTHYAAKFPIYLATSKQFRQEFYRIFCNSLHNLHMNYLQSHPNQQSHNLQLLRNIDYNSNLANKNSTFSPSSSILIHSSKLFPTHRHHSNLSGLQNGENDLTPPRTIRQRPSPGLSRTVIDETGKRVLIQPLLTNMNN